MSACACGRDKCNGKACGNFGANGCKGVDWSLPPWDCAGRNAESTATVCIREQDVLEAADILSQFILDEMPNVCLACLDMAPWMICETCRWNRLGLMAENYQNERKGIRR